MTAVAAAAPPVPPPTDSWRPVWTLLVSLAPYRSRLVWASVIGILAQTCAVGAACAGAWLVGHAVTGSTFGELRTALVLLLVLALGQGALAWLQTFVAHDYAFRMITGLRQRLFGGMEALAPGHLQRRRTGDLAATLIGDLERLEWLYAHILPGAVAAVVVPAVALAVLATLSPLLAAGIALIAVLLATVPVWLSRRAYEQGKLLRAELGGLHAEVVDGVQGLRELVAFGHGTGYLTGLARRMNSLRAAHLAYGRRTGLEGAVVDLLSSLATVVTLLVTGSLVAGGELAPEYFAVVVLLVGAVLTPMVALVGALGALGEVRGCAARVVAVAEATAPVVERPAAVPLVRTPGLRIAFEDVSFRYRPELPPALDRVGFCVRPDETVALVGRSGAGKSTCAHLLLRFWDPDSGRITFGGVDLRDLTLDSLRAAVALVPQDVYLFRASFADNIRLARPDATDAEVRQAAERANAAEFIDAAPQGYRTLVSERGASLSGGQRQRIAIARAFLRDAPLLILDEATSNVDADSEVAVRRGLADLTRGRATLVIAHRRSTVETADRVVMLAGGQVAAEGSHRRLVAAGGDYAALWQAGAGTGLPR